MIGGGEEVDSRVLFLVFPSAFLGSAGSPWARRRSRCDGSATGDQTHPVWLKFVF